MTTAGTRSQLDHDAYMDERGALVLRICGRPLLTNDRVSWQARARRTRDTRELATWLCRSIQPRPVLIAPHLPPLSVCHGADLPPTAGKVVVRAHARLPLRGRPCDHAAIEPAVKAALDGIVDAGVIPDDGPRYLERIEFGQPVRSSAGWAVVIVMEVSCG